jgi:hypothetical protein
MEQSSSEASDSSSDNEEEITIKDAYARAIIPLTNK